MDTDTDTDARQQVNSYKFQKKPSEMGKRFGTIQIGDEERYNFLLFPMESNLLKINRIKQINNGRRVIEAVCVCLFVIDGYLNKIEYDLDEYLTNDVELFAAGLLMAFDPFVNENIETILTSHEMVDKNTVESLSKFFRIPIKCLIRINQSIELWTKELGVNGYFNFLEKTMGKLVQRDEKMEFAIRADNL